MRRFVCNQCSYVCCLETDAGAPLVCPFSGSLTVWKDKGEGVLDGAQLREQETVLRLEEEDTCG